MSNNCTCTASGCDWAVYQVEHSCRSGRGGVPCDCSAFIYVPRITTLGLWYCQVGNPCWEHMIISAEWASHSIGCISCQEMDSCHTGSCNVLTLKLEALSKNYFVLNSKENILHRFRQHKSKFFLVKSTAFQKIRMDKQNIQQWI